MTTSQHLIARSRVLIAHSRRLQRHNAQRLEHMAGLVRPRMAGGDGAEPEEWPDLSGLILVVVDDDEDSRQLLALLFTTCGARVLVASDADSALSLLSVTTPDVIVSDLAMPRVDGITLMEHVRSMNGFACIPAIAVTGFHGDYARRATDAGYNAFVQKPVQFEELCAAVVTLTRDKRV